MPRSEDWHRTVLTYCGLADDFAARYDRGIRSVEGLNRQLLLAVLFGEPLLFNDGYVVTHGPLRKAVIERRSSPFRKLVEEGYVKILTRNDGALGSLLELMAEDGITSAKRLRRDTKANKHFEQWAPSLQSAFDQCFRQWPECDVSVIFQKIGDGALSKARGAHPELEEELNAFQAAVSETRGRRTDASV